MTDSGVPLPEALAAQFHEAYERLAPKYDYKTRPASAVPWNDVPVMNRLLMVATVEEACGPLLAEVVRQGEEIRRLRAALDDAAFELFAARGALIEAGIRDDNLKNCERAANNARNAARGV